MENEILQQILNELKELKENQNSIQSHLNKLETKVDSNHKEVLSHFDDLKNQLHELEATNAANHVSTNAKLNKISDDLDFLTHKEFQTEKEMFHLKRKLSKQRKSIR